MQISFDPQWRMRTAETHGGTVWYPYQPLVTRSWQSNRASNVSLLHVASLLLTHSALLGCHSADPDSALRLCLFFLVLYEAACRGRGFEQFHQDSCSRKGGEVIRKPHIVLLCLRTSTEARRTCHSWARHITAVGDIAAATLSWCGGRTVSGFERVCEPVWHV